MSTLRISDAPLLPDVDGTEKIPTGGRGDYAISVDQIKDHIFQDVGKELVGLGNVDNTSDLDKPVSTAQQAALDLKADKTYVDTNLDLKADKTNVYTRSETSLALSKKADLVNGVVPESQIPSSFNDVLEFTTPNLPIVGESGKIYVTTDTNKTWRWATNKYVEISNGGVSDSTLKLQTPRKIANVDFDGAQDISIPHNNLKDRDMAGAHPASAILDASGVSQQEINGKVALQESVNNILRFNTVNVLDYIPESQHALIANNQLTLQDQTAVTAGFSMAALHARTYLKATTFIVPSGEYATNDTILLDLPNGSNIQFDGVVVSSVIGKPALVIGSYTTNRFYYNFQNVAAYHVNTASSISGDTLKEGCAVLLMNIVACTGNIKRAKGFWSGVLMDGSLSNGGSSYNQITLGFLKDNVWPLRLKMTAPGYCNENTFYGGSMGHSGSFPYTGEEVDIKVDKGIGSQKLNNNLFFRPSLESNNLNTKAAVLEGNNNQIYMPRIENSQNYGSFTIEFGDTSDACAVYGGGFGLKNANIVDNGVNNKYQNSATFFWSGDASLASGRAAFEIKNTAGNAANALRILNTSNVETFRVLSSGTTYSAGNGYFENGIRWRSSNLSYTDRGLFLSTASPEGVTTASPGSICIQTSNSKIFVKKSGLENTGWRELVELITGTTAQRPTVGLSAGISYFDTTLNKPIWYNGTVWVDATGATV